MYLSYCCLYVMLLYHSMSDHIILRVCRVGGPAVGEKRYLVPRMLFWVAFSR